MSLRIGITSSPLSVPEFDPKQIRRVLRSAGAGIAAVARRKVRTAVGGGRLRRALPLPRSSTRQDTMRIARELRERR